MADEQPIEVAIWSDVVCPFCNVARERAEWLRERGHDGGHWLPYDLHPEYPDEGIPRDDLMRRYPAAMHETVRRINEEAGLAYNPHPERVPRTRRALELIEWARGHGWKLTTPCTTRIMDAYWTEGRDIMDWDVLARVRRRRRARPRGGAGRGGVGRVRARGGRLDGHGAAPRHPRGAGVRVRRAPAGERRAAARGVRGGDREGRPRCAPRRPPPRADRARSRVGGGGVRWRGHHRSRTRHGAGGAGCRPT